MKLPILTIILLSYFFISCSGNNNIYLPKPKGFNRIDLPQHKYQLLEGNYPYSFEVSDEAEVKEDMSKGAEPYWIIVDYPKLDAKIQFTYKPINGDLAKLDAHVSDAYKLASKHQVKATSQIESVLNLKSGKKAVIIELYGEVPSHFQFYITDTTKNYLRGATYLKNATLNDSLTPVVEYLKVDCKHILETLKWKNK